MPRFQYQCAVVACTQGSKEVLHHGLIEGQRRWQLQQQAAELSASSVASLRKRPSASSHSRKRSSWLICLGIFTQKRKPSGTLAAHLR